MIELDDLHIFRTVVREGSVTRAAVELHRVPSNVTTRIKQFEGRLGVRLFRRQGRGLALTEPGERLLGHAERLLRLADEAERAMRGDGADGPVGTLRLGSLESAAGVRLPPLLSTFHARHPGVSIELRTGTTAAMLRQLEQHEIEAAFVSEPFDTNGWSTRPVFEERLVLITAADHPPVRRARDLDGHTVVAFPHGCAYRRRLVDWLSADGATPERFLDLGSYHAIVACVAAGTGAAIVPEGVLDHAVLGGEVQRHALPDAVRHNRTHLVWADAPGPALQALIDLL